MSGRINTTNSTRHDTIRLPEIVYVDPSTLTLFGTLLSLNS